MEISKMNRLKKGLFCGIVPIVFEFDPDGLGIDIKYRWYSPYWLLDAVASVYDFFADLSGFDGGYVIRHIKYCDE